ncbi:MAG TPA: hypothetical protein VGS23_09675 [Thermoplasmata archaeon]|nr:hypothetical protein [Thermoplasmata archaeon]
MPTLTRVPPSIGVRTSPWASAPLGSIEEGGRRLWSGRGAANGSRRAIPQFHVVVRMLEDIDRLQAELARSDRSRARAAPERSGEWRDYGRCVACEARLTDRSEAHSTCSDCGSPMCSECGRDASHDGHAGWCPTCWTLLGGARPSPPESPGWRPSGLSHSSYRRPG